MAYNIQPLKSSDVTAIVTKYSHFLNEVRKRFLFTLAVFAGAMFVGFTFYEKIIKFIINLLSLEGVNIVFTSPFQFINLAVSCGLATGIVAVSPLFISQLLSFLKPALRKKEFSQVTSFLPFSILLFLIGFGFGAVIMKWQIEIFLTRSVALGIGNILDISGLLTTVLLTSVFMGVGFQFPIVLLLMLRLEIIDRQLLISKRKWIYLGSFIFTIFLPPDSILADVLLALPLIILYESVLLMHWMFKNKKSTHQV